MGIWCIQVFDSGCRLSNDAMTTEDDAFFLQVSHDYVKLSRERRKRCKRTL